jgi:hypothetical protein
MTADALSPLTPDGSVTELQPSSWPLFSTACPIPLLDSVISWSLVLSRSSRETFGDLTIHYSRKREYPASKPLKAVIKASSPKHLRQETSRCPLSLSQGQQSPKIVRARAVSKHKHGPSTTDRISFPQPPSSDNVSTFSVLRQERQSSQVVPARSVVKH